MIVVEVEELEHAVCVTHCPYFAVIEKFTDLVFDLFVVWSSRHNVVKGHSDAQNVLLRVHVAFRWAKP